MNNVLDLGPHATYIVAAYGAALLVLGGLIGWIRFDARQQMRLLDDLEAKGIRRRSARSAVQNSAKASKGERQ